MVSISLWFTLGTLGMALGVVGLTYGLRWVPEADRRRYTLLIAVPGIAVVAYALLALGVGGLTGRNGTTVYVPRYADWLLTTPLHVLHVGLLAGASRRAIGKAVGLQVVTIFLGFLAALTAGPLGWLLYAVSSVAFLGVIYQAYGPFATAAASRPDATEAVFRKLRAFMFVLWLMYPVVWMVAGTGFGLMDVETTALVVSYLDVVAKVGFGLIALNGHLTAVGTTPSDEGGAGDPVDTA